MPNPTTYGDLKRIIDEVHELILRLQVRMTATNEDLWRLRAEISGKADAAPLDSGHASQAARLEHSATVLQSVNPEEMRPC